MTTFQQIALLLMGIWLVLVVARFRRSSVVLIGGLFVLGLYTLLSLAFGRITLAQLGLGTPKSWWSTIGFALAGLGAMLVYSPLADRLASHWFSKPPTLDAFRGLQQSTLKLLAGIITAWLLGGILEELIARGIVLKSLALWLASWLSLPVSAGLAICIAAIGAGFMHFYQGRRAVFIIAQLSVLFGVLFVVSGYNLWTVMLCHGLYDTIAFVRFAARKSGYSKL